MPAMLPHKRLAGQKSADQHETGERDLSQWLRISTFCLMALTTIAFGMLLMVMQVIVLPVIAGLVLGLVIGPVGDRGKLYGVPPVITWTVMILALVGGVIAVLAAAVPALDTVLEAIPMIKERFQQANSWVSAWTGVSLSLPAAGSVEQATVLDWVGKALSFLTPALSQILITLFTLILFLVSRQDIRNRLVLLFEEREQRLFMLRAVTGVETRLADYLLTVGLVNAGLAALVAILFWAIGMPGPVRWAAAVFLLNFLPVIGPLLIKAALAVYAITFAPSLASGLVPLAVFALVSLVEANAVTPRIVGQRMTMNALVVFLSVIFWTWLWGFPGAFLAMPFLAIASAILAERAASRALRLP